MAGVVTPPANQRGRARAWGAGSCEEVVPSCRRLIVPSNKAAGMGLASKGKKFRGWVSSRWRNPVANFGTGIVSQALQDAGLPELLLSGAYPEQVLPYEQ